MFQKLFATLILTGFMGAAVLMAHPAVGRNASCEGVCFGEEPEGTGYRETQASSLNAELLPGFVVDGDAQALTV